MRIYISGAMSHVPEFNFPKFFEVDAWLQSLQHQPINPAAHDLETYPNMRSWPGYAAGDPALCPEFDLRSALEWDMEQILRHSDAILVLDGWTQSKGARLEVVCALAIHLPIYDERLKEIHPSIIIDLERKETILEEAARLVDGDRQAAYGHPLDDYTRTAKIWGAILGTEVTPEKALLCMIGVKISREAHKPKRDNRVDGCGYWRCLDKVYDEKERRQTKS